MAKIVTNGETVKMQSPWVSYTNKIREMFKRDPEIRMTWDDNTLELKMYVDNPVKAEAIAKILPSTKAWGKNVVSITVIPSNFQNLLSTESDGGIFEDAFSGNPIYHFTRKFKDAFLTGEITYVVFAKEVIQYFNDDLNDLFANANTLAEDIAREIFENVEKGTFFCTDIK